MSLDNQKVQEALTQARDNSKDIKFNQTVDLIVILKDLDLKKTDHQVDFFMNLPNKASKPVKVCGLVGSELIDEAKKEFDYAIQDSDFGTVAGKKTDVKRIANEYDFFVAQANVMPKVAQSFGRVLGPRGKMPNPKAGCVVPPKAQLGPIKARLQNTIRISVKKALHMQIAIATQDMEDEKIIENVQEVYSQALSHLPLGINNIKKVMLKLTMSTPQRVY